MILTYLDSPVAKVFPRYCLFLSISAILKGKRERGRVKVRTKVRILQNFFKQCFCLLEYLPMVTILAILDHTWESRGQKTSQIGLFCGCWIGTTFNLTTTNAILTELTKIIYLHESVNRKALRARNPVFWLDF